VTVHLEFVLQERRKIATIHATSGSHLGNVGLECLSGLLGLVLTRGGRYGPVKSGLKCAAGAQSLHVQKQGNEIEDAPRLVRGPVIEIGRMKRKQH
jgi:hypothetical protein